jgi:hypothetical protein
MSQSSGSYDQLAAGMLTVQSLQLKQLLKEEEQALVQWPPERPKHKVQATLRELRNASPIDRVWSRP